MYQTVALGIEAVFVVTFFILSFQEPENVRLYPQAILVLMGICVAISTFEHWRVHKPATAGKGLRPVDVVKAFALLFLYIMGMNPLGYIVATVLFYLLWLCIFNRNFRASYAVTSVAMTMIMFYVFGKLFSVPLPEGLLTF